MAIETYSDVRSIRRKSFYPFSLRALHTSRERLVLGYPKRAKVPALVWGSLPGLLGLLGSIHGLGAVFVSKFRCLRGLYFQHLVALFQSLVNTLDHLPGQVFQPDLQRVLKKLTLIRYCQP